MAGIEFVDSVLEDLDVPGIAAKYNLEIKGTLTKENVELFEVYIREAVSKSIEIAFFKLFADLAK